MLAALGFATVLVFLAAIMSKRLSVLTALVIVPVIAALVGGFAGELGTLVAEGMATVAPVAIMITFAVLYFSLMVDEGLFDPVIRRILAWAGGDPVKITVGTAVLTLLVALDGDGASTFLITVSALLPIYQRLGMRPLVLTGTVCLGAGVMNMVPWGGSDRTSDGGPRRHQRGALHPLAACHGSRDRMGAVRGVHDRTQGAEVARSGWPHAQGWHDGPHRHDRD